MPQGSKRGSLKNAPSGPPIVDFGPRSRFWRAVAPTSFSDRKKHEKIKKKRFKNQCLKPPQSNKGPRAENSTKHWEGEQKSRFFVVSRFEKDVKNQWKLNTKKRDLIGNVASGGFSSKISFFEHLIEETKIRFNNRQNIFMIFICIINALVRKFFKLLIRW